MWNVWNSKKPIPSQLREHGGQFDLNTDQGQDYDMRQSGGWTGDI